MSSPIVTFPTMLKLTEALKREIESHGIETYPHECCGALIGKAYPLREVDVTGKNDEVLDREVFKLMPLANQRNDSPRNRFEITPEDFRLAEKTAQDNKLELIGWYHSHPDAPARPSEYDRDHAWPWYSYIIVSVQKGVPRDMTSWRLRDDRSAFDPEGISTTSEPGKSYRYRVG